MISSTSLSMGRDPNGRHLMPFDFTFRTYAQALYDALRGDAFYNAMEQSVTEGSPKEAMIRYMDYSIVEAQRYGAVHLTDAHYCGVSVWARPLDRDLAAEKHRRKLSFVNDHMGAQSVETYTAIVEFMSEASGALIDSDSWYLSILGLPPASQGRGLGGGLVEEILGRTDASGVPTYLETFTPRNMSFYHRLGYRAIKGIDEPTTGSRYWLMARGAARS